MYPFYGPDARNSQLQIGGGGTFGDYTWTYLPLSSDVAALMATATIIMTTSPAPTLPATIAPI